MNIPTLVGAVVFALFLGVTLNVSADLVSDADKAKSSEISQLGSADAKFVLNESAVDDGKIEQLALNKVGSQGLGDATERSTGCSTGCSVGCSTGCSVGCR